MEQFKEELLNAFQECTKKERDFFIVSYRTGVYDGEFRTLKEVGEIFGISRERVRQIEQKLIRRVYFLGNRNLQLGKIEHPCSILINHLKSWILPGSPTEVLNIATLALRLPNLHFSKNCDLIVKLCYPSSEVEEKKVMALKLVKHIQEGFYKLNQYQTRQKNIFNRLFSAVAWPPKIKTVSIEDWNRIKPKRQVNILSEGESGSFFSKKNNTDIEFESQLEYNFCAYLEELENVTRYVQQPFEIPYTIDGNNRIYIPDFFVLFNDGRSVIVEIKSRHHMGHYLNIMKWIGLQKFCLKHGFGYLIIENYNTINDYIYDVVDEKKRQLILSRVINNSLNWREFRQLKVLHELKWREVVALILQEGLKLTLNPFNISNSKEKFEHFISNHKLLTHETFQKTFKSLDSTSQSRTAVKGTNNINKKSKINKVRKGSIGNIGLRWSSDEEAQLVAEFKSGMRMQEIAEKHGRNIGGILARLRKNKLID